MLPRIPDPTQGPGRAHNIWKTNLASPLLTLRNLAISFGGEPLLSDAEFFVHPGDRLGLVGRNGSGKSTILKIAAGLVEPDSGDRVVRHGKMVRYLAQEPDLAGFSTTLDAAVSGLGPAGDPHHAEHLLDRLGLTGHERPSTLSGGEQRRCAIAQVLAPQPDILLLDEPTNHLDLPAIEWLEAELGNTCAALVVISHDRRFLSNLTRTTLWLDRGRLRRQDKGFADFETWRDQVLEDEETARHKLDRKIVAEEHWVRHGVSARRKRNQKRLRDLSTMRQGVRDRVGPTGRVAMGQNSADPSGKRVAEVKEAHKRFGDRTVVTDLNLEVQRGDRLAIVGPNGSGKTTILNMLTGSLKPDEGSIRLGANIRLVSLDQRRDRLDATTSLRDALTGGGGDIVETGGGAKHVIAYMKDFLFTADQAGTPLSALSGGERGRLMLAIALAHPSNLLVLDEPTNDLDLETLDLLQELLSDYAGTVLVVSHDRDFIDRVATSVLAFEGDGIWTEYAGGYSDMIVQRKGSDPRETQPKKARASGKRRTSVTLPAVATPRRANGRLGFKEKHALKVLPERIATLEREIGTLDTLLADSALYTRDPSTFSSSVERRENARQNLAKAEEEWLALEVLREEFES
jgi:ATP-binding cassette subfamily F protein uup